MDKLYNWLFHYNHHTGKWTGFHRDDTTNYWNGGATKFPVFVHEDFHTIVELIKKIIS